MKVIKLSELQIKEVIEINSGKKLGHIYDLEIDPYLGKIVAIILVIRNEKNSLFGKQEEKVIYWEQIVTIGADVILVKERREQLLLPDAKIVE